ncbi:hypothetical protein IQ06DRAFT_372973 [Phaeosphaeriaceae sp. SRC1lsM3a]|nr:hypothetical protein IQ06DRAFT_372973 [Stagonospora sp. SRC1lsM3a]
MPLSGPYHYRSISPTQPPNPATQAHKPTQAPAAPLEQRILDLLYPYRDECFSADADVSVVDERKAMILCENIAFFIRHTQSSFGKIIETNDISLASRNWCGFKASTGPVGIGIFVNGIGATHNILRVRVEPNESVIDSLMTQIDGMVQGFFPELWNGHDM